MKRGGLQYIMLRVALSLVMFVFCLTNYAIAANKQNNAGDKAAKGEKLLLVSAEGLADVNADVYKKDKGIMVDDLRNDAKRQIIEKAAGVFMESSTVVENYAVLEDKVFSKSQGFIKNIVKESPHWVGEDGFAHMLMKAEVQIGEIKEALKTISKAQRISLLKELGNPKISVKIIARDAERGDDSGRERSVVAENVLKEHIKGFGYTVWSEMENKANQPVADFTIDGEAKFKVLRHTLPASGVKLEKYVLTSWSVRCLNNHTGEEIYFNNKVPEKTSWATEDLATKEIGKMIGSEFSADFFAEHLQQPSIIYQLEVMGMPDYDTGELFKREFIGLRSVLNVDFRNFNANGPSLYEVEFAGNRQNFTSIVNNNIIKPINQKIGANSLKLLSAHGNMIQIGFAAPRTSAELSKRLEGLPPSGLSEASPERLKSLVKSDTAKEKLSAMNVQLAVDNSPQSAAKSAIKSF